MSSLALHPDRLLPPLPSLRTIARELHETVAELPIVSMHGHIDPAVLAADEPFPDPASLLVTPDHYVTRILHSQGVPLDALGHAARHEGGAESDPRAVWEAFCRHWPALRGTPSSLWLAQVLVEVLGVEEEPSLANASDLYEHIARRLGEPAMGPRELYRRFGIEVLATTDSPLDDLAAHRALAADATFAGTVIPTFRPDAVLDPSQPRWAENLERLEEVTRCTTGSVDGLLDALARRRRDFIDLGARATDHGPPTPRTVGLDRDDAARLYDRLRWGRGDPGDAELLRGFLLMEMARMSGEDGLVMQLHAGVLRDHDGPVAAAFGPDVGADFPMPASYTEALQPVLETVGSHPRFTLVAYTVDEASYGRELAPMASYYPALKLGAPWWFLDAPDGMRRCWRAAVEPAGFSNFAGFVDDARTLCAVPARHDMARRIVCGELARLVAEHRLELDAAREVAVDYVYRTPRAVFGL